MRYFFDTEFIEDGKTIDLISIGVVSDEGHEFYRVNAEARLDLAGDWVKQNVIPQLPPGYDRAWAPRSRIRDGLTVFVGSDPKPEFWAYYGAYDWVALCQLYGTMMQLPKNFPHWCRDLKQLSASVGSPRHPPQEKGLHHALEDARYNRLLHGFLMAQKENKR